MVDSELYTVLVTGIYHLIGLNKVECDGFFTEDMDTALCSCNRGRIVHRCLRWDDDDVRFLFVKHLFIMVIDCFDTESSHPMFLRGRDLFLLLQRVRSFPLTVLPERDVLPIPPRPMIAIRYFFIHFSVDGFTGIRLY